MKEAKNITQMSDEEIFNILRKYEKLWRLSIKDCILYDDMKAIRVVFNENDKERIMNFTMDADLAFTSSVDGEPTGEVSGWENSTYIFAYSADQQIHPVDGIKEFYGCYRTLCKDGDWTEFQAKFSARKLKNCLDIIDAKTGTKSTPEQQLFAADFTRPLVSFSNPGTGKSHSLVKGLIMAQTYHKVPGRRINAMSFTREATAELKVRYDKACKACDITPTVQFNTFHSICRKIIEEAYPRMKILDKYPLENLLKDANLENYSCLMEQYLAECGVQLKDKNKMKEIYMAIDKLNKSMVYDPRSVELSFAFKKLDISLESFQQLRSTLFFYGTTSQTIHIGDIPLYALFTLSIKPEIRNKYYNMYDIMVVDEFQDMTKLYLTILSMISKNLIVIGDIKQQIYGFNGACSEIVEEYYKMYPNARRVDLTQSFRCKNEIAEFATSIYRPNDKTVEPFKGVGDGGTVQIINTADMDVDQIISSVKKDVDYARELATKAGLGFDISKEPPARSTMFLFRNNFSVVPIAEKLYKQNVDFRIKNFKKVMDLPIYDVLCKLASAAQDPDNEEKVRSILCYIPEFRLDNVYTCPFMEAFRKINARKVAGAGTPFYEIDYPFQSSVTLKIMGVLKHVNKLIQQGAMAESIFDVLWPVYEDYIIEHNWWKLDMKPEFYKGLVLPIVTVKPYDKMVMEELAKEKKIKDCINNGYGVKCYTMHSAKGLEADDVYILDVESVYFPSKKNFNKLIDKKCTYEAAKQIREERNLLYVGITRAKERVILSYTSELSELVSSPSDNEYTYLDEEFAVTKRDFKDAEWFIKLMDIKNVYENIYHTDDRSEESEAGASLVAESVDIDDI